nr:hypothetical protein [uncultured Desulfobulbus sp.]
MKTYKRSSWFWVFFVTQMLMLSCAIVWAEGLGEEEAARIYNLPHGRIDSVGTDFVIIDDLVYSLSGAQVYTSSGFLTNISSLQKGEYVAYEQEHGKIKIYAVDEIEERPQSSAVSSSAAAASKDPGETVIRQVDGVWKN